MVSNSFINIKTVCMELNKIMQSNLLDIVFENRNKSYGAYELRTQYNRRLSSALIATGVAAILLVVGTAFASNSKSHQTAGTVIIDDVNLVKPKEEVKTIEPEQPLKQPDPVKVKIDQFTPPKIVANEEVKPEDVMKDNSDLNNANIGKINQDGIASDKVNPPKVDEGTAVVDAPVANNETVFVDVQIQATFPGGADAWKRYLEKNLDPQLPSEKGAPEGRYTVIVEFVVDKEGNVSDVKALTNLGYGMEEEAMRVIKQTVSKGIKWTPAEQNGMKVKAFRKQPITFVVSEE